MVGFLLWFHTSGTKQLCWLPLLTPTASADSELLPEHQPQQSCLVLTPDMVCQFFRLLLLPPSGSFLPLFEQWAQFPFLNAAETVMRALHPESGDLHPFLCLFTHDRSWLFALTSVLCLSIWNSRANARMLLAECVVTVEDIKDGGKAGKGFVD